MINISKSEIVLLQQGDQLRQSIVEALVEASNWIREAYGLQDIDLATVSTKTFIEAALPAHVERYILKDRNAYFDEEYVQQVWEFLRFGPGDCNLELYAAVTRNYEVSHTGRGAYRKAYLPSLRRGFAAFMVALHIRRAIVLPFSFQWPKGLEVKKRSEVKSRREICPLHELPELVRFIRSVDYRESAHQIEEVFSAYSSKQRERLVYMGQRLIVAAGWLELKDVNYEDMLAMKEENDETLFTGNRELGFLMLCDLLKRKFGDNSPVSAEGWREALKAARPLKALEDLSAAATHGGAHLVELAARILPTAMAPEALAAIPHLPGIEFNLAEHSRSWLTIQRAYIRQVKRENEKGRTTALGYFNVYLFGYLPYWYAEHPDFAFAFPTSPNKFVSAAFVTDLGLLDGKTRPMTFVDFLCAVASLRNWGESSHYAVLKQVEVFFEFIERRGDALPDSNKFRQPLLRHDYPRVGRSKGTKKRPIPRRAFKLFISYVESLVAIANVITDKALDGSLTTEQMSGFDRRYTTIDFQARQNDFGFIPVIFHEGRTFPVWRAQNVFNVGIKKIKGRGFKKVPHPHALNQLLVSLYTGLRQNHIQWLDRYRFDEHVSPEEVGLEFGQLFVNTDKVKERGWISFVNFRVIEILRSQRAWCDRIDEPGFNKEVFYNDNPESKWGSFFPLFSYSENGSPHSDALYSKCWLKLLTGLQDVLQTVGMFGIKLIRLLPVSIAFDDPEVEKKLREFGAGQRRLCAVICKSDISPHSARVSVVSHAIAILPADLIGRHWTGQSASTVFHYVVPDEDETFVEQQRQQLWVRQVGYDKGYEAMLKASPAQKGPFIKADAVNSNLSQSLRANPEETIAAYGLISLSFGEQSRSGIEILRETRGAGALEGKTEICPHGGICPPEVVAELKGWKRCGPCPRAVRSIDHLPAVTAKIRQVLEELTEFEVQIAHAESSQAVSDDELDALEGSRATKAEDMASWQMVAEVLETMRQRIASGISTKSWHVRQPEIVERHLRQVPFPTNATEYVLLRLQECEAFPMLESPQIRARFDMMRRHLLANTGNLREALRFEVCPNPGAECLGLLRSIVAANKLSIDDLKKMFESDYLEQMPPRPLRLLATESADTTQNEVLI